MNIFKKADIMLPENVDYTKWSVVACDQYTSEPEYWESVGNIVGDSPSTLNLVYPEVFLSQGEERIKKINDAIESYIDKNVFYTLKNSLIHVEREIENKKIRHGIVGAIDLEEYDFNKGSTSCVRATEGTVLERIPPRVKIRQNAKMEFPHIMILIDDEKREIIEEATKNKENYEKIYDFDLMMDSGNIKGYRISDEDADKIISRLDNLEKDYNAKYNLVSDDKLIFAVGDGNHSLATAKRCWEDIKKNLSEEEIKTHPARFALCELVNLHDDSLEFKPIHRVLFGVDENDLMRELEKMYDVSYEKIDAQSFEIVSKNINKKVYIKNPTSNISVGTLQNFLDEYMKKHNVGIDYVHGDDVTKKLGTQESNMGFLLPCMKKNELFITVIKDGALPRKTFSMGEAKEKRFYIEGKKIK